MLNDNLVTRFPNGLTNVNVNDIFASMIQSDPTKFHTFYQDFDTYLASQWVVTITGTTPTAALVDGNGGLLALTNTSVDNDNIFLQTVKENFFPVAGKRTFFKSRFKVSDATQIDAVVGLQITDTTPLDVTDGIYFLKADDAATVDFIVRKNATTGSTSAAAFTTLADDTFVELAWFYDGVDRVYYAVNGTVQGYLDGSATYLPDSALAVSFGQQNGAAASKVMTVDYIFVAQER